MSNVDKTIGRMLTMMNYGLQTESKNPYSTVEYHRVGADGKMYGIVREGTKYYIKVSNTTKGDVLKENFEYLGGFVNRSRNEFTSYANALKHFDQKMTVIKENYENKSVITEAWNPNAKNEVMEEATEKMRKEIARQRQIMENASRIMENKACECIDAPYCDAVGDAEDMDGLKGSQKPNLKGKTKPVVGKGAKKEIKESEVLGWNDDENYLDKSHGTTIGDSAPFNKCSKGECSSEMKNGVVEEDNEWGSKGLPSSAGVGEIGDDAPFDDEVKSGINEAEEFDDDVEDDFDAEDTDDVDFDSDEEYDDDFDSDLDDVDLDDAEDVDGDMESRMTAIEDMLGKIADKLGVDEFEDDELYDDDELADETEYDVELGDDTADDDEYEVEMDDDLESDDEDLDSEDDDLEDEDDEDMEVVESRSYRNMRKLNEENRLNDYGKHPAWRKKVMTLPQTGSDHTEHGDDWNDESVHNELPYAKKIGSGAPFSVSPQAIDNAIAEAIRRVDNKRK